jgi:hypothetical protein
MRRRHASALHRHCTIWGAPPDGRDGIMAAVRTIITRSLVVAALAALLPACQSCSDKRSQPAAGGDGDGIETRRLQTVKLQGGPGMGTALDLPAPRVRSFELQDAGKEPRQALRYGAEAGENALTVTVRVDTRELVGEEWTPWGTLPELRYGLALRREAAGSALDALDAIEIRGLDMAVGQPAAAEPDVAAYVARATEELSRRYRDQVQGRRASATIDARGHIEVLEPVAGGQPAPGAHTRQEMLQILAESVVPLPEEPVGAGARWRVTMLMRRGAGMVNQTGTYELVAIESQGGAPSWRIRATIKQDGEHQTIVAPELPSGVSAELVALLWRAEGELEVSPRSLTPRSGKLTIEYGVHSRLETGGPPMDLLLESKGAIELATAAAAP